MKLHKFFISSILMVLIVSMLTISFATYTSPYQEPTTLVKYGSSGNDVKWVQDLLRQNGYTIEVDGSFGSKTRNAVMHFQKYNSLSADGIVGELTRKALKTTASYTSSPTNSVTTTSVNKTMYTTANVNFRNGPSTSNSSYGILSKGTQIYVLQHRSDNWSYVKYNNKYGYISSSYISITSPVISENNTLPIFNRSSLNLLDIIKNCKKYYASNNFSYSLASGVRSIPADKSKNYSGKYYVDCSTYVSWVLYEYANANGNSSMKNYFSYQRNSATFASIAANGGNDYLKVVNSLTNAQEGDILITQGHVEFLSSYTKNSNGTYNIKVYNCGSNSSISAPGITTSATKYASEILYILRVK